MISSRRLLLIGIAVVPVTHMLHTIDAKLMTSATERLERGVSRFAQAVSQPFAFAPAFA